MAADKLYWRTSIRLYKALVGQILGAEGSGLQQMLMACGCGSFRSGRNHQPCKLLVIESHDVRNYFLYQA